MPDRVSYTDYLLSWQSYLFISVLTFLILINIGAVQQADVSPLYIAGASATMPALAFFAFWVLGTCLVSVGMLGGYALKELFTSRKGILAVALFCIVVFFASCPFADKSDPYEFQRELLHSTR